MYRTLSGAFQALAVQTNKESEAHSELATIISGDICLPLKELADAQYRERKSVNEKKNINFFLLNLIYSRLKTN